MAKILVLLTLLSLLAFTSALSCTARYQCQAVSQDYNYADCINGNCQCLTQQGFIGAATPNSLCNCASGNDIEWKNGLVYCLNLAQATQLQVANARTQILTNTVRSLYLGLIGNLPYSYINASLGLPSSVNILNIFDPSAIGRIDPFGTFNGPHVLGEYYYVFAVKNANQGIGVVGVDFVYLYGSGDNVFVRVNIGFGFIGTNYVFLNITESGNYRFGPNNTLVGVDAIAHNVGQATAPAVANQTAFIIQLCEDLTMNPGSGYIAPQPNGWCPPQYDVSGGGYSSFQACVNFMNSKPFGSYDNARSDTVICRRLHADISKWDPFTHCQHAGETGGGMCIDVPQYAYFPPFSPVY